ncbi:hypothetical protein MKW98_030139 [Papaver atlanticum]|uniref:F-box domain-containing protein n=1 Tax=Papaver atlanticum TaxID=357466 RepID=A0AAD4T7S2_9MAGN|nr:hypothetical protein MKW98_030139 [Papaver atlanticum]
MNETGDDRPCKIRRTLTSITNLPSDSLSFIFKCLTTKDDRNSFGLTCRQWFRIQNNNHESLWSQEHPCISAEIFPIVLCKLLTRFQHLEYLSLRGRPKITDFFTFKSQFFESKVQSLCLDDRFHYSDIKLSLLFSWFPHLTHISLKFSRITDNGLEAVGKCCSSLKVVNLSWCRSITDSGISLLLQTCSKVGSLYINSCHKITGIGFLECAHTLNHLELGRCKLKPERINAIVSGGGLKYLRLTSYELYKVGEGSFNTETVMTISRGCPLLKELILADCEEVELEAWEAIGKNCKYLEFHYVYGCRKLCDLGLEVLFNRCNKLSRLFVDGDNSCSSSALKLVKRKKPK